MWHKRVKGHMRRAYSAHITLLPFLLLRQACASLNWQLVSNFIGSTVLRFLTELHFFLYMKILDFPSGPMSHNETGAKIAAVMVLREKTECQKSGMTISQGDCCCNRNDADDILFLCADVHVRRKLRLSLHFHRAICPQQTSCRIQVY